MQIHIKIEMLDVAVVAYSIQRHSSHRYNLAIQLAKIPAHAGPHLLMHKYSTFCRNATRAAATAAAATTTRLL